ncbi:MAG: peptidylprolyl isomerase [Planctomycetota bacterium]
MMHSTLAVAFAATTAIAALSLACAPTETAEAASSKSAAAATAPLDAAKVSFEASTNYVAGEPYLVKVEVEAGKNGSQLAPWILTPSAFLVDGVPIGERTDSDLIELPAGAKLTIEYDLGPHLEAKDFALDMVSGISKSNPVEVTAFKAPAKGTNFLEMAPDELSKYLVELRTNRGSMLLEMWPDKAPNHVRNYLDLANSGFYNGVIFHRIIPGFMIQGGDPTGTGGGNGPRVLNAEFSDAKHVRGVLSAARTNDPNSASCQFFIMHQAYPSLDGQYSAFGKLVTGYDTLDLIVNTPRDRGDRPLQEQRILSARVLQRIPKKGN